jgi:uncharacterized protein YjbI with pentapeptide repeats
MRVNRIVIAGFVAALAFQGVETACAWNAGDIKRLQKTKNCEKCDLSEAKLGFASLHRADLRGADLHGVYLNGAFLLGANLSGANLSGAILDGATWTDGSTCESGSIGECRK